MTKPFAAEILFCSPDHATRGTVALAKVNCAFTVDPELRDPCGEPCVWGMATGETELDLDALSSWLNEIVRPLGGDLIEWGYGPAWKIRD
jgi:hypothetical protein